MSWAGCCPECPSGSGDAVKLCAQMHAMGYQISERTTGPGSWMRLLAIRKTMEGGTHEHLDAQFEHIAQHVAAGQPAISIDAKKKELVGFFANKGKEWQPKCSPVSANVYDFVDPDLGKVMPCGLYDLQHNMGWDSVGIDP